MVVEISVIVPFEFLLRDAADVSRHRIRYLVCRAIHLPSVDPHGQHLVHLSVPPVQGARVGKVDVHPRSLPPTKNLTIVYGIFVFLDVDKVRGIGIHEPCYPQDHLDVLGVEIADHLPRVRVTFRVPCERIVIRLPWAIDDDGPNRNVAIYIALHQFLGRGARIGVVLPNPRFERPSGHDGRIAWERIGGDAGVKIAQEYSYRQQSP